MDAGTHPAGRLAFDGDDATAAPLLQQPIDPRDITKSVAAQQY